MIAVVIQNPPDRKHLVAVYDNPDKEGEQLEREVFYHALTTQGELIPLAWDPGSQQFQDARLFKGFLGLIDDEADEDEEGDEEITAPGRKEPVLE
jgi:hypothetical protein